MSLVALALPQPPLRMKTMAEKSDLSPAGEVPVIYHESEPVPTTSGKKDKKDKSKHKKNPRKNEAMRTLAQTSATAPISIALSDPNALLIRSAPSSPEFLKPRRPRAPLKLKSRSKGAASSDPESSCTSVSPSPSPSPLSSPNRRPLFLWPRKRNKKNGSREVLNGPKTPGSRPESPNVVDRYGSGSSIEPEATSVTTLPGGRPSKLETRHSGGEIPTIFVSHDEHNGGCVEQQLASGGGDGLPDDTRKMSQTSVGSNVNSANSGYCTLSAAGSGDEAGSFSDLDYPSPVSPSSMTSSHGGSVPNLALMSTEISSGSKRTSASYGQRGSVLSPDSEPDYPQNRVESNGGRDVQSPVATPTTPLSAPLTGISVSPLPGPRGVSPPIEGSSAKSPGRIRDPYKKRGVRSTINHSLGLLSCSCCYKQCILAL